MVRYLSDVPVSTTATESGRRAQNWLLRAIGLLAALLGGGLTVLGLVGAHQTPELATPLLLAGQQLGEPFDPSDWQRHWSVSTLTLAALGGGLVLGGIAIVLRKRWGFLVLGSTLLLSAAFPWTLRLAGISRYPFEKAGWVETAAMVALACSAYFGFTAARRMPADETPEQRG